MAIVMPNEGKNASAVASVKKLEFGDSRRNGFIHPQLVLEGPPGEGKTFCALTVSEQCPDELYDGPSMEVVDTAVIQIDPGGLDGLLETRVTVRHVLDLSHMSGLGFINGLKEAIALIRPLVDAGTIKNVVVDTASVMDKVFQSYLQDRFEGPQLWGAVRKEHMAWFMAIRVLPVTLVTCCHLMNKVDYSGSSDSPDAKKKREAALNQAIAQGRENPDGLCMDVTGAGGRFLRDASSLILPIRKVRLPMDKGGSPVFERHLLPYATNYDAKSRFTKCLGQKEPANLRALINKVRAGIASRANAGTQAAT